MERARNKVSKTTGFRCCHCTDFQEIFVIPLISRRPKFKAFLRNFGKFLYNSLHCVRGCLSNRFVFLSSLVCLVFRLARPLGILWLYSDTHKLPNVSDSVDIIQAEPQTTSPSEVSLAKGHWKLKSEVSKPSFFENNYGFSKRDTLQVGPFAVPCTLANATCTHC